MTKEHVSPAVPHKPYLLKRLADPATAAAYINAAASEDDPGAMRLALRNVFQDLAFSPAAAHNLMLRARLLSRVRDIVRGETQREAAKRFGITQPRLNDVLRGRIDKFSLDALVNMLAHAGIRVELRVKKAA